MLQGVDLEVAYNVTGTLAHLIAEGAEFWEAANTVDEVPGICNELVSPFARVSASCTSLWDHSASHLVSIMHSVQRHQLVVHRWRALDQLPVIRARGQIATAWTSLGGALLGHLGFSQFVHVQR